MQRVCPSLLPAATLVVMSNALHVVEPDVQERARSAPQSQWRTVVHDDPVNTMDYVTWVFRTYFGFPLQLARRRMLEVHTRGRATVSTGARERIEAEGGIAIDYIAVVDDGTFDVLAGTGSAAPQVAANPGPATVVEGGLRACRVLVAARVGGTRLIDNMELPLVCEEAGA